MISRPVRAGLMRERIVIQTLSETRDDIGGLPDPNEDTNWSDYWRCWADVQPITGRELQQASKLQAEVTVECRTRYKAGITTDMRVLLGSTVYDIRSVVDPGTMKRELVLGLRERQ